MKKQSEIKVHMYVLKQSEIEVQVYVWFRCVSWNFELKLVNLKLLPTLFSLQWPPLSVQKLLHLFTDLFTTKKVHIWCSKNASVCFSSSSVSNGTDSTCLHLVLYVSLSSKKQRMHTYSASSSNKIAIWL